MKKTTVILISFISLLLADPFDWNWPDIRIQRDTMVINENEIPVELGLITGGTYPEFALRVTTEQGYQEVTRTFGWPKSFVITDNGVSIVTEITPWGDSETDYTAYVFTWNSETDSLIQNEESGYELIRYTAEQNSDLLEDEGNGEPRLFDGNCSQLFEIKTSSTLGEDAHNRYHRDNLTDHSLKTAWVEGTEGLGLGEQITFELKEKVPKHTFSGGFTIVNGYDKSVDTWQANARVQSMIVYGDGVPIGIVDLEDTAIPQFFSINYMNSKEHQSYRSVTFETLSAYFGNKYEDLCISALIPYYPYYPIYDEN